MRVRTLVVVTLMLAGGVTSMAWARAPQGGGVSGRDMRLTPVAPHSAADMRERMRLRVGITPEQSAKFEALHEHVEKQRQAITRQMRQMYDRLMRLYDEYAFDRNEVNKVRNEIHRLQRRRMEVYAENEEQIRKILTREQFKRFRAMLKEQWEHRRQMMERFQPGGSGNKHLGPGNGGPRPPF